MTNMFKWRGFFTIVFTIILFYIDTEFDDSDRYKINPCNRNIFQVKIRFNFT